MSILEFKSKQLDDLKESIISLNLESAVDIMHQILPWGEERVNEALYALGEGMIVVGDMFENGEYFLGDLIYAAKIMQVLTEMIKQSFPKRVFVTKNKMLICTVENDVHDIGKNIVKTLLEAEGIEVIDMGVNVDPISLVDRIIEEKISVVALSGVLSFSLSAMNQAVNAIRENPKTCNTKIIVGGECVVSMDNFSETGADVWGRSVKDTVDACKKWLLD